jgi:ArsR family transcriptional regulator
MKTAPAEKRVYKMQAEILKALANPVRLEIIHRLGRREVPFGELQLALGITKANLSQHLTVLRKARIVADRRRGVNVFYRLAFPEIEDACEQVGHALAKHLLEVGQQARVLLQAAGRRS